MSAQDETTGYAQLTVRIPSQQRFAAYDRAGRLLAGSPDAVMEVEDYWVFEHALRKSPANRWRLAGRLSILPHEATAAHPQQQQAQQQAQQAQQQATQEQQPSEGEQQRMPRPQAWGAARKAAAPRAKR
jgi:large subunit ribosomal protein L45